MATNTDNNNLERLKFSSFQRLYASDIHAIDHFSREMRWQHNRSLHRFGIGSGYAVSGQIGDREVSIESGYAIDSQGREIVLTRSINLPVLPVAGSEDNKPIYYYLTVSYPEASDLEETETRKGICHDRDTVRLREEPDFCWVKLDSDNMQPTGAIAQKIKDGKHVILSQIALQDCALCEDISIQQRQNARPAKGPNIVPGIYRLNPNKIEWKLWTGGEIMQEKFGLKLSVDTTSAQFTTPPDYNVEILGERFVDKDIDPVGPYILDGFQSVLIHEKNNKPISTGFDLYIQMREMCIGAIKINPAEFLNTYSNEQRQQILYRLGWSIKWVGIE